MPPLTHRQRQVYSFLSGYQQAHGCPPTLQEIAAHLGITGNLGVLRHLRALERAGLIGHNARNALRRRLMSRSDMRAARAAVP